MKHLKTYVLFPLLLLLIIVGLQWAIDVLYIKKSEDKISLIMKHKTDADIMVFGSSVANAHFDPEVIEKKAGLSVYNMGWDGIFFAQYNGLIKEYLSYQQKCRCIVIACDFDNLGKNELITRPDLFYAHLWNDGVYESLHDMEPGPIARARYVPGYKFTLLKWPFYSHLFYSSRVIAEYNGYAPRYPKWDVIDSLKKIRGRYEQPVYEKLKETLQLVTAKGIKVVIVIPPVYKDGYKLIANAEEIKNYYRALERDNVFFRDYTQDTMCTNRRYFYNFSHMNGDGAAVFSQKFANDLMPILNGSALHTTQQ